MILEYIWIDRFQTLRSKVRVLLTVPVVIPEPVDVPLWNYDGSSTGQADLESSEIILTPVAVYPSPFSKVDFLVLCDSPDRAVLKDLLLPVGARFAFEQEFYLSNGHESGYVKRCELSAEWNNYCRVRSDNRVARQIVETAMTRGIAAGISITGINAEVSPNQWEIQVDDFGIAACDDLWMMRYILMRTAEESGYNVLFHPKPYPELSGSGCHTNYSDAGTLAGSGSGIDRIYAIISCLESSHAADIEHYGIDNRTRLTGKNETQHYEKFTYGVADRGASIRIPRETVDRRFGYFEDRRPAANCNPYVVAGIISRAAIKACEDLRGSPYGDLVSLSASLELD